jgi:hypothetical protein
LKVTETVNATIPSGVRQNFLVLRNAFELENSHSGFEFNVSYSGRLNQATPIWVPGAERTLEVDMNYPLLNYLSLGMEYRQSLESQGGSGVQNILYLRSQGQLRRNR